MAEHEGGGCQFDRFHAAYDEALARGLAVSGEDKVYFARGRILFLNRCLLQVGQCPTSVLDFGCGTGTATPFFLREPGAETVVGVDASERSLEVARAQHGSASVAFQSTKHFTATGEFALAFCNGVFHHVPPAERGDVIALLRDSLQPGGVLALWDNNPWNPGARLVMSRIPFDRDAVMLSSREARQLLAAGGLQVVRTDYLFVFPRFLRSLRFFEAHLTKAPFGAQYQVLAQRPPMSSARRSSASSPGRCAPRR